MVTPKFDVTKGNKDWHGAEAILRERIRRSLEGIFHRYGYDPIDTPITEYQEVIAFKGGGEIQKEVFRLKDQGGRDLALRFDQTVPLARFIATHQDIVFPFKRSVIGPVFRDGPTQPEQGRYRQFTQCDVDVLGIGEMTAEAELLALAHDAFRELGLGAVEVKINDRKLLEGVLDYSGVPTSSRIKTIVTLDKMDKIGLEDVRNSLYTLTLSDQERGISNETLSLINRLAQESGIVHALEQARPNIISEIGVKGLDSLIRISENQSELGSAISSIADFKTRGELLLTPQQADKLVAVAGFTGDNEETYKFLSSLVTSEVGLQGLKEMRQVLDYSKAMGFEFVNLSPSLARGLDYYTGPTMEVYLKDKGIIKSAILAGGRFDNMVGEFRGGEKIPAVGFSFGLERLVTIISSQERQLARTNTQLYLVPIGTVDQCLRIAHELRNEGINVDMQMQPDRKMGKSIAYALAKGIPYVGVVGDMELADNTINVKELATRKEERVPLPALKNYMNRTNEL
ncbi:MAG: histidine--tRNA ligase [Nanoarchaeota archaeon]|nr:histidine--tRNA ligase [Nanoarchaeota archaeon]